MEDDEERLLSLFSLEGTPKENKKNPREEPLLLFFFLSFHAKDEALRKPRALSHFLHPY